MFSRWNVTVDADGKGLGKLDFKQRLSIALGAAKGINIPLWL
jgi:hypothetical protein